MARIEKILLVEDDPNIVALITAFLSNRQAEITSVSNTIDALEALSSARDFDLIILDFWLGSGNAVNIMDEIASTRNELPIMLISGGNGHQDLEVTEAISQISGATFFLQKPFPKAVFNEAVNTLLDP